MQNHDLLLIVAQAAIGGNGGLAIANGKRSLIVTDWVSGPGCFPGASVLGDRYG